jgi:single-strand DNA-binding protein
MNFNRTIIAGNLTRDPELRYLPSNSAVVALSIAVNRKWKNQQGQPQEEVSYIDCEAFGKTAETINQYFRKGQPIFIEGRLKLDQWTDKEGQKRSKLKVIAESFSFVGGKRDDQGEPRQAARTEARGPAAQGDEHIAADDDLPPF